MKYSERVKLVEDVLAQLKLNGASLTVQQTMLVDIAVTTAIEILEKDQTK